MINKTGAIVCLALALSGTHAQAEGPVKPIDAISSGQLVMYDGSSFYIFNKNKSFESVPTRANGRTIKGTWNLEKSGDFRVNGIWGKKGAESAPDFRTMLVHIDSLSDELREMSIPSHGKVLVREGNFVIEELKPRIRDKAERTKEFLDAINGSGHLRE